MADQIERLIEAVKEVGQKLTRLSTYYHPIIIGAGVISAVSSVIGNMASKYFVGGAAMSSSGGTTGSMDISRPLESSTTAISSVAESNMPVLKGIYGSVIGASSVLDAAISYNGQSKSIAGVCAARTIIGHAVLEI